MHQVYQALLYAVPIGKMVVLDLVVEVNPIWTTSNQFFGVPYFWYYIGGRIYANTLEVTVTQLIHQDMHVQVISLRKKVKEISQNSDGTRHF
ncbi:hypothetical protein L1987_19508 [Smallanthus sonchifolius]|uniref:Uncharacterized protein n=1 Tax=Smallanthus sonchifolius TaxID=185202 RepID=A0ACB9IQZ5_9ASTR|nr:hypothetical protein L1987_19508 [Smallanthus sonchifolius]